MAEVADVAAHYASGGIAERILAALREAGAAEVTPETLAPLDQFHSRGLAATREIGEALRPQAGQRALDIGCGIGGPARWLAQRYGCTIEGVDLTAEFCAAAETLNRAAGMADRVSVRQGDALALPFADASFDLAYSQNVVMNIADKVAFYREAGRVLKPGGLLAVSNLAAGAAGEPYYPTPWAASAATSFLSTPERTRAEIAEAGLELLSLRDTTPDLLAFYAEQRERLRREGPPALGVHVLVGERIKTYQRNVARGVEEGRLAAVEAVARKP